MEKLNLQTTLYQNYLQWFDDYIKVRKLSITGKGSYHHAVKEFLCWLEEKGIHQLKKVNQQVVVQYLDYLSTRPNKTKGGTLSDSTIKSHFLSISLFFENLLKLGVMDSVVYIKKFQLKERIEREILTQEEIQILYRACENKLEQAILTVAYGCALRRTEMYHLDLHDVILSKGKLQVTKGKNYKQRTVVMSNAVCKYLKAYVQEERSTYLKKNKAELAFFLNQNGGRMSGSRLNQIVKNIIERTQNTVIIEKNITLHSLRHSIATHLLDNGRGIEFVKKFLGHEQIDTSHLYAKRRKRKINIKYLP